MSNPSTDYARLDGSVADGVIDPDLGDVTTRYVEFHRRRGNDLAIGLRLAQLLAAAGLEVISFQGAYNILPAPPGTRPPGLEGCPRSAVMGFDLGVRVAGRDRN
jgi:hypothetical protein